MGQTIKKPTKVIRSYIHPVPGTSGCTFTKKNYVSVYTEKQIILCKTSNETSGEELKKILRLKTGQDYLLYLNNEEINYSLPLCQLGINEKSLLKAKPFINDSEKSYSKTTTASHRRTCSAGVQMKLSIDADLSVYAAPEVGQLKKKANNKRGNSNIKKRKRNSIYN